MAMTGATIGKVGIMPETSTPYYLNQRVGMFENPSSDGVEYFLFPFLTTDYAQTQIKNRASGAAQPNISNKQVESIEIVIPSQTIMQLYIDILDGNFKLRQNLLEQNEKLKYSRDLLLPRLMNGEIPV